MSEKRGASESESSVSSLDKLVLTSKLDQKKKNLRKEVSNIGSIASTSSMTSKDSSKFQEIEKRISLEKSDPLESSTSGYFSDSASETVQSKKKQRKDRARTMSPIPRFFKFNKSSSNDKIQFDRQKIDDTIDKSTPKRESIYSRIVKSTKKEGASIKTQKEPLYARIRPKFFGDKNKSEKEKNVEQIKEEKTAQKEECIGDSLSKDSHPSSLEPVYSTIKKGSSDQSFASTDIIISEDKPIYKRPLPKPPTTPSDYECGKFVVKAKEIKEILPSKPDVITISNPSYANVKAVSKISHKQTIQSSHTIKVDTSKEDISFEKIEKSKKTKEYSTEKATLSKLVEELAQELESVTRRTGLNDAADDASKREVLMKLLSHYDVPKATRPIGDFPDDVSGVPTSASPNELRIDEHDDVYGDAPDYSQDEFVIALDDENDPKYATLTQEMKKFDSESGQRSTQMYVNVINVLSALKVLIHSNSSRAATVINKMGTIARPYANKVQSSITDTTWIQRKFYHKTGHNGFDELRKYIKSGGEFCKELAVIMHERAELESNYAKGLHKLSTKLLKASRESMGSVSEAWQSVGTEFEHEGDIHRIFSSTLTEDVVRPLRQLIESQYKVRKGVEGVVDKTTKNLADWRTAEVKAKKTSFHNTKENEKVQDMLIEARLGRGRATTEKDIIKLEKQRKKAEEAVHKSDLEYYSFCVRTERARQDWETALYKGSNCFQSLEEERLSSLKDLVQKYTNTVSESTPKLVASAERLKEPSSSCNVEKDIKAIIAAKGTGMKAPEQTLPDFFAEDLNNPMNKTRRREALDKFLRYVRADLDRERRGKQGVENLAKALQETPNFGGEDSQQDVNDKLEHMKAMLAYLEAARYKIQDSLNELDSKPRNEHPLAKHIDITRDKQGLPVSILKVPQWRKGNSTDVSPLSESPDSSPNWNDRGTADGNSVQPDSDFADNTNESNWVPKIFMHPFLYPTITLPDEFSSQASDQEYQNAVNEVVVQSLPLQNGENPQESRGDSVPDGTYYARPLNIPPVLRCKALYDYDANLYDELTIRTGDIINIHEKQLDGWWLGELDGSVGIFPATYVEEIDYP